MKKNWRSSFTPGILFLCAFGLWTVLVQTVDVQSIGPNGTSAGMAAWNLRFHKWTGVHLWAYTLTDWLGLVPVGVCMAFGGLGLVQLAGRKSLWRVDRDILILGVYYVLVIGCYLFFEAVPINCRPILIKGRLEASYPSSTTLLVLSVMPALIEQVRRRVRSGALRRGICGFAVGFSAFMVIGRTLSGVHWLTDIVGAVLLSGGMFTLYRAAVKRVIQNGIGRKTSAAAEKPGNDAGGAGGSAVRFQNGRLQVGVRPGLSQHRFFESTVGVFLGVR